MYKLSNRMRDNYESRANTKLMKGVPVIIRVKNMQYCELVNWIQCNKKLVNHVMVDTARQIFSEIQGCKLAFVSFNETIFLLNSKSRASTVWFDYNSQKICSTVSSMFTSAFINNLVTTVIAGDKDDYAVNDIIAMYSRCNNIKFKVSCFNVPVDDVANYFYYKQSCCSNNMKQLLESLDFKLVTNLDGIPIGLEDGHHDATVYDTSLFNGVCIYRNAQVVYIQEKVAHANLKNTLLKENALIVDDVVPRFNTAGGEAYVNRFVYVPIEIN